MDNEKYVAIMRELANRSITAANTLDSKLRNQPYVAVQAERSRLLRLQAEIILAMLEGTIPLTLRPEAVVLQLELERQADPDWVKYQELKLKFSNA